MNIHIELSLHNAFQAATAARGENMTDVILKAIEDYVARYKYDLRPRKKDRQK